MIEVHSVIAVLGLEVLAVLLVALAVLLWRSMRGNRQERTCAGQLVERINAQHDVRMEQLGTRRGFADLPEDLRRQSLHEVALKENELYRHVIRAFLDRDTGRLAQLDRIVQELSEPYCTLIASLIEQTENRPTPSAPDGDPRLAAAETALAEAESRAERINHQLGLALAALDEVSSEYTKMFGEPKSMEELQASRNRMLEAFRRTEQAAASPIFPALREPDAQERS